MRILIQRVGGVGGDGCGRDARATLKPVANGVILIGPVAGVDVAVG